MTAEKIALGKQLYFDKRLSAGVNFSEDPIMKFGLFLLFQHHREDFPATCFRELIEQAELAEAVGFDALWVGDHHVVDDTYFPPLTVLAGLATRTSRVTLGTAPRSVPPLASPLPNDCHGLRRG